MRPLTAGGHGDHRLADHDALAPALRGRWQLRRDDPRGQGRLLWLLPGRPLVAVVRGDDPGHGGSGRGQQNREGLLPRLRPTQRHTARPDAGDRPSDQPGGPHAPATGAGAPHPAEHLPDRRVAAVERRQLRHGKGALPVASGPVSSCSGLARMAARCPRAEALAAAIDGTYCELWIPSNRRPGREGEASSSLDPVRDCPAR